ncbi:MAG TPA: peptide chain release factor N(5)-glutamine methyltransferase [Synergistaceae bacterium]|nr:peptide chain release factor N(5)-glutamine methyltransferase [Synergistaceae bacterium]HQF90756.1 peptide chain release factor N(5)-glutamine methyltransferase [Synergistaceae bacterium]HQH77906.1 peptide chain release factor N(5)-glutamine methyltransferase [Synergistaceae bacterium]HQK24020.1 peptide chain release factor N(5)-glutamine methyltransferase [Synergistaceae bacterium]
MRVDEGRRWGAEILAAAGVVDPQRDVDLLLEEVLYRPWAHILAHPEGLLSPSEEDRFRELLSRRASREPMAYILGEKGFWGRNFAVGPGCLIPRDDTEALMETVLGVFPGGLFVDWGTGSGCLAATLALERPASRGVAVEASPRALVWARRNLRSLGVLGRVDLVHGKAPEDLSLAPGVVDLVVSNPPYIPSLRLAGLMPEVGRFEPAEALDGGDDGMDFYRMICPWASTVLKEGGYLAVEVGDEAQAAWLRDHGGASLRWQRFFYDLKGEVRGVVWKKTSPVAYNRPGSSSLRLQGAGESRT